MKALILGGGGMIGQKLAHHLANRSARHLVPHPAHHSTTATIGNGTISELILHDLHEPSKPHADIPVTCLAGDISDPAESLRIGALGAQIIFHLAAIVSGEAERDFDKGMRVNLTGSLNLLHELRAQHIKSGGNYTPRLIFASSIAVFGGPYPELIDDLFLSAPQTSYGTQKAMTELMVADYSRKGWIDGLSIRLPTICVRPGKANLAASSFFSGIIREPLNDVEAILPVRDDVRHWHASPRSAVGFLTHAAALDTAQLEGRLAINMPGLSCTVAEQIEALRHAAGEKPVKLIRYQPDPDIMAIVSGWPRNFDAARATALGFRAEQDFAQIIQAYIEDDVPGFARAEIVS